MLPELGEVETEWVKSDNLALLQIKERCMVEEQDRKRRGREGRRRLGFPGCKQAARMSLILCLQSAKYLSLVRILSRWEHNQSGETSTTRLGCAVDGERAEKLRHLITYVIVRR